MLASSVLRDTTAIHSTGMNAMIASRMVITSRATLPGVVRRIMPLVPWSALFLFVIAHPPPSAAGAGSA